MLRALLLAALVLGTPAVARCGIAAPPPSTFAKFVASDAVVVGKVTAIEKGTVEAVPVTPGVKAKLEHTVAVVKIDGALVGAANLTHIKVGFVPPDPNAPPARGSGGVIRPREPVPELKDGQEVLLFLVKHPTADFHVMPNRFLPLDLSAEAGKKELEAVKRWTAALADPMKGLTSDKADVRVETAAVVLTKYRTCSAAKVDSVALPADESKLILKALTEGDWTEAGFRGPPNARAAFYYLGLTEQDGWKAPTPPNTPPGKQPPDFGTIQKEAFVKWLDGPGKDYRVKKLVPKK